MQERRVFAINSMLRPWVGAMGHGGLYRRSLHLVVELLRLVELLDASGGLSLERESEKLIGTHARAVSSGRLKTGQVLHTMVSPTHEKKRLE